MDFFSKKVSFPLAIAIIVIVGAVVVWSLNISFFNLYTVKNIGSLLITPDNPVLDNFSYLGKGCTTAYYIDKDCDGYGVGKRSDGVYVGGAGDMPDADDNDESVWTATQALAKWGSMRNFLIHKGYSPNHIYYVALNGNDATGVPDDPIHPYAIPVFNDNSWANSNFVKNITAGDIIIYRQGEYNYIQPALMKGNSAAPIVFMVYPGEQAFLTSYWGGISLGGSSPTEYLIFDGFSIGPTTYVDVPSAGASQRAAGTAPHITLRNLEVRHLFWGILFSEDYFTLEDSVLHDNNEHNLYLSGSRNVEAVGAIVRNNIFGMHGQWNKLDGWGNVHNNGYWRGTLYENNIIHSSCGTGLDFQAGSGNDAVIRNNLIFGNGRTAFDVNPNGDCSPILVGNMDNITFANNILYVPDRTARNDCGVGGDAVYNAKEFPSIALRSMNYQCSDSVVIPSKWGATTTILRGQILTVTNVKVINNILDSEKGYSLSVRGPGKSDTTNTLVSKNNIAYHRGDYSNNFLETCSNWNCDESIGTAVRYSLSQAQSSFVNIRANSIANPLFTNVSPSYYATPGVSNFNLTSNSPAINFGISEGAPTADLRGNLRDAYPDAGAYEFTNSATTYTLSLTSAHGLITKSLNKTTYNPDETVLLTVTADAGYSFTGWSGDVSGTTNPITITMNSNKSVTANYVVNTSGNTIPAGFLFSKDLSQGMNDQDVVYLKIILSKEGCFKDKVYTDAFTSKTTTAVRCFQNKYKSEISAFTGYAIKSSGFVGVGTRLQLNVLITAGVGR